MTILQKVHAWVQRRERAKAARARIARAIDCLEVRRSQEMPPTMPSAPRAFGRGTGR